MDKLHIEIILRFVDRSTIEMAAIGVVVARKSQGSARVATLPFQGRHL